MPHTSQLTQKAQIDAEYIRMFLCHSGFNFAQSLDSIHSLALKSVMLDPTTDYCVNLSTILHRIGTIIQAAADTANELHCSLDEIQELKFWKAVKVSLDHNPVFKATTDDDLHAWKYLAFIYLNAWTYHAENYPEHSADLLRSPVEGLAGGKALFRLHQATSDWYAVQHGTPHPVCPNLGPVGSTIRDMESAASDLLDGEMMSVEETQRGKRIYRRAWKDCSQHMKQRFDVVLHEERQKLASSACNAVEKERQIAAKTAENIALLEELEQVRQENLTLRLTFDEFKETSEKQVSVARRQALALRQHAQQVQDSCESFLRASLPEKEA